MKNKILITFLVLFLLSACISVQVDDAKTPTPSNFVTATLAPTKAGFVPLTLTPTLAITETPTLSITIPANCTNTAVLLRDVTIQDNTQVKTGEKFTKTWEFQNTGTCPWIDYSLKFAAGDQMNAPLSAPIAATLPNEKVQVSVELTAPPSNGAYTGYFTLNDPAGKDVFIGVEKTFWVKVVVGSSSTIPAVSGTVVPTQSGSTTTSGSGGNANCGYSQNSGYANQIASLINLERANAGLPSLTVNSLLTAAAQGHAGDMACNSNISHTGSNGSSVYGRVAASGYSSSYLEEIIYGGGGPQAAITWWMSDQIHRDAILSAKSTEMGVGYANYSGDYIVVDFGSP
jgi:uncharacterized protein YkwD